MISGSNIEVGGRQHGIYVAGEGGPTVVLEPALGDVGLTWGLVQPEVAAITATFTHDRPGLGDSDHAVAPRTVDVMVDELRAVLGVAGLHPPYVLVGHSFASLTVQAFANPDPDEVAGVVLVDGAHEDQMERFPAELAPRAMLAGFADQLRELARAGRRGEPLPELVPMPESFPEGLAEAYRAATAANPVRLETSAAEYEGLEDSQAQVRALDMSALADIPIVAIRHGRPQPMPAASDEVNERYEETWQTLQEELAARSNSGRVIVAEGAGHMIHHDRPGIVVEAIRELLG